MTKIARILAPHGRRGKLKMVCYIVPESLKQILINGEALGGDGKSLGITFSGLSDTGKSDIVIASICASWSGPVESNNKVAMGVGNDKSDLEMEDSYLNKYSNTDIFCDRINLGQGLRVCDLINLRVYIKSGFKKLEYGHVIGVHNFGAGDILEIIQAPMDSTFRELVNELSFDEKAVDSSLMNQEKERDALFNLEQEKTESNKSKEGDVNKKRGESEMYLLSDDNFPIIDLKKGHIILNKKAALSGIKGIAH